MHNRIKQLREERGWSMRELAARVNSTSSTINKLEKGFTRLNVHWIEKLSAVFAVPPENIVEYDQRTMSGFEDDAAIYEGEVPELALTDTQFPYMVKSNALSELGILPGRILIIDQSPNEMSRIESGDIVIVQYHKGTKTKTLLRQFIAPHLLITNSQNENAPIINRQTEDAQIMGVVVASHERYRAKLNSSSDANKSLRLK